MYWLMTLLSATTLQFEQPPLVLATETGTSLEITVRLNRPVRFNVGHPAEYRGERVSIEAAGGGHDVAG